MTLLASPLESIESAVIWLLVVFSVATWGLALVKGVQFARLKSQDRKFHNPVSYTHLTLPTILLV